MGKRTEEARFDVMGEFPGLCSDEHFLITSPIDYSYNCIAWAYQIKGRWMWPPSGMPAYLDAVTFWPDENASEEVEDDSFEEGYRKIALYITPGTTNCTHAARQLSNGFWTSKLGRSYDIQHSSPKKLREKYMARFTAI